MNSIIEFLETHEVDFKQAGEHSHVRHGWVGVDCPWCGEGSQKYHLGINLENNYAVCWRCSYHNLSEVLSSLSGEQVSRADVDELRRGKPSKQQPRTNPLRAPTGRGQLQGVHRRYLKSRGLDADLVASQWDLKGIGLHASLSWRIFIPIYQNGKMVSWTTRATGNHSIRYMSAKPEDGGVPIKHTLYGADFARHSVIVVEGPADAWAIGPGAVATYGTAYSQEQVAMLSQYPVRVVCFDAEPAAQAAAGRLCEALHVFPGQTCRVELGSGDPGEATKAEIRWLRRKYLDV